jgi:xanthine dehydrogenase accessory factor
MRGLKRLETLLRRDRRVVRVSIAKVLGSAPREVGATLLVTDNDLYGTIGGGSLEYRAIAIAREMLSGSGELIRRTQAFPLGADLGQCCGGNVTLCFDPLSVEEETPSLTGGSGLDPEGTPLWIYGAGHVGRAVVRVLADTPFAIRWIDERAEPWPSGAVEGLSPEHHANASTLAMTAPAGSFHLVMTHDHDLDYRIVRALLADGRFAWLGLIGSETKATCFRIRLAREGVADDRIARVVSPIGIESLHGKGKTPAVIAIAAAAQLLIERHKLVDAARLEQAEGVSDE